METMNDTLKIAVVDDHGLYRKGLINLIQSLDSRFEVVGQASNGQEFIDLLSNLLNPDLAIVDIDMPVMNGFETAEYLKANFPKINILVITMSDDEQSLVRMLRFGVKGFLSKDVDPEELRTAIKTVSKGDFHNQENLTTRMVHALQNEIIEHSPAIAFSPRELDFIRLCCTELTYKEIAEHLHISPKTIEGHRGTVFDRIGIKTRVGLVMYAIKHGIVKI